MCAKWHGLMLHFRRCQQKIGSWKDDAIFPKKKLGPGCCKSISRLDKYRCLEWWFVGNPSIRHGCIQLDIFGLIKVN